MSEAAARFGAMVVERLSLRAARRIALAAQGFADPKPAGRVDARHIRRVLDRTALLQIDSVNVLSRSHYLPVFSRLGSYPHALLDDLAWGRRRREMYEFWAHEASLLPLATFPLLRWRMEEAADHAWGSMSQLAESRPAFIEEVLAVVHERGPIGAGKVELGAERPRGGMWNWHDAKIALEWLFYTGRVTTAGRRNFERLYDLTERVIPESILATPAPSRADAQRELVRIAARSHGVATDRHLRDYFRLSVADAKARVAELVEAGELLPVTVDGARQQFYLWPAARMPRRVTARALLSPFDSLIWERTRTELLFDFHYRLEIYTPAVKRVHGYYVLPFLLGEELVGRVDLKADRKESRLLVQAAYAELGVDDRYVAAELVDELTSMATWLGLDRVATTGRGDLGPALEKELASRGR